MMAIILSEFEFWIVVLLSIVAGVMITMFALKVTFWKLLQTMKGKAIGYKFQFEEPKEETPTLGIVLHILRKGDVKRLLPDAEIIGYVVSEPKDSGGKSDRTK